MKLLEKLKQNYDYVFVLLIWILIFTKNIFSQMIFVDFTPDTYFSTLKMLALNNYASIINPLDILRLIFTPLHLLPFLFQFSILISMFLSYFYIKKLFKDKELLFSILFMLIYFFNPFVYSRIMIGQLGVLIAYILIPMNLFYIFEFFEKNLNLKSLAKIVLAITFSSLFSIHFFVINIIIFLVAAIVFYKKISIKKILTIFPIFLILLILINSFWIQGLISNNIFQSIDSSHEDFFSPKLSNNIPAVAKIIGMSGFWRESAYKSIFDIIGSGFYLILLSILLIIFLSAHYISKDKKSQVFYILFWIGLVLGTGISHPYTRPFFDSLFKYLPFFNGFRDSHKLVSLIALSYASFIPILILEIRNKIKKLKILPVVLIISFIIFFTFPLIGLGNQIKPIDYPKSYSELNSFLDSKEITGKIIYLPWQTYLTYNWTINSSSDGRIAVPINQIIKYPVLIGPDIYGSETIENHKITSCLEEKSIQCLENNSVQFIIQDKCTLLKRDQITENLSSRAYSNTCIDLYELNPTQPKTKQQIPLRFIISSIISILTLTSLIVLIRSKKLKT